MIALSVLMVIGIASHDFDEDEPLHIMLDPPESELEEYDEPNDTVKIKSIKYK